MESMETILVGEGKMISQRAAGDRWDFAHSLEGMEVKVGSSLQFESLHKVQISWGRHKLS